MKYSPIFIHDMMNILVFMIINLINLFYFVSCTDFSTFTPKLDVLNQEIFSQLFHMTFVISSFYTVFDSFLVIIVPQCVKSESKSIIYHHLATCGLMYVSTLENHYCWYMSMALLLELNTLLLTIKRNVYRGSVLFICCNAMFYISWILFRMIMLPYLVYLLTFEYIVYSHKQQSFMNAVVMAPVLILLLTILSFQWTLQLFKNLSSCAEKTN